METAHVTRARKPGWLKRPLPTGPEYEKMRRLLAGSRLSTVCQEAKCPNMWECFSKKTATFMILGSQCTRNCRFCNVTPGTPPPPDPDEPQRVAQTALELGLTYVVVTSVTRDDLPDGGAAHFAATIQEIRKQLPKKTRVEVLIPDFQGDAASLQRVMDAGPDVLNHNIETVPGLYPKARPEADYQRSLTLLQRASQFGRNVVDGQKTNISSTQSTESSHIPRLPVDSGGQGRQERCHTHAIPVKSGLMVGLGETREALKQTIRDLKVHGCDILTMGQYLQPSKYHLPVMEYYTPEAFEQLKTFARSIGFKTIASGPFVRSSYQADQLYPRPYA